MPARTVRYADEWSSGLDRIALIGNPNCGKNALSTPLTASQQKFAELSRRHSGPQEGSYRLACWHKDFGFSTFPHLRLAAAA